ncbi:MAG: CPBP family intramembrane metalloprotease [Deltaproteobacteria bacterium]|nr:MAG: CPBP family intramembrane metalloprotease [Deltaproteobacteria bacterium]
MSDPFEPSEAPPSVIERGWNPLAVFGLMVAAMLVWRFFVECGIGIGLVAMAAASGANLQQIAADPAVMMRADVLAIGTAVQLGGMVVVLGLVMRSAGWSYHQGFGLRGSRASQFVAAVLGGSVVGFFAGYINEFLISMLPDGMQLAMQEEIVKALTEGPVLGRVLMVLAVAVAAPVFEELAFRGALWDAVERIVRFTTAEDSPAAGLVAMVVTSLAFAAYHLDPIHVLSLMPTAFMLGWLRYTSRSVWPGILAHFVNNGLATVLSQMEHDPSTSMPWWAAAASLTITLVACTVAGVFADRESA